MRVVLGRRTEGGGVSAGGDKKAYLRGLVRGRKEGRRRKKEEEEASSCRYGRSVGRAYSSRGEGGSDGDKNRERERERRRKEEERSLLLLLLPLSLCQSPSHLGRARERERKCRSGVCTHRTPSITQFHSDHHQQQEPPAHTKKRKRAQYYYPYFPHRSARENGVFFSRQTFVPAPPVYFLVAVNRTERKKTIKGKSREATCNLPLSIRVEFSVLPGLCIVIKGEK